jgi:hypothetical protein
MTFVSEDAVRQCAQGMIRHIREKFPGKTTDLEAWVGLEVGHLEAKKALVRFVAMNKVLRVNLKVSISAATLFGGIVRDSDGQIVRDSDGIPKIATVRDFPGIPSRDKTFMYIVLIQDQTSVERIQRKIKRLLVLHLYCSREKLLSRA